MKDLITKHIVYFKNSSNMDEINDESIDLVVTSPPYPMIEMWDQLFSNLNPDIKTRIKQGVKTQKKSDFSLKKKSDSIKKYDFLCVM